MVSFSYLPAASSLHDSSAVAHLLRTLDQPLAEAGGVARSEAEVPVDEPLVHVVLTGGSEQAVLERLGRRHQPREPVVLVAHPGHNSLPASLEILARVRRDGGTGRIVFVEGPQDTGAAERVRSAVHLSRVAASLSRARLGVVGEPSEWLVASSHDAPTVRASWGPELVSIGMAAFRERLVRAAPDANLARELKARSRRCEVAEPEIERATSVYRALEGLVAEHRLWAVTVRCFDLVLEQKTTGCLALSRLADEGIPAGCEGDIPSALAMLWVHLLTGDLPWMANPARVSAARGELVLAHCTVPRSMVGAYDVRTHFESGLGVALGGDLSRGPVTLLRLGGAKLEKAFLAEGELVAPLCEEGLCRTAATFRVAPEALRELLEHPLGNHLVVVPGHREALLRESRAFVLRS